MSLEVKYFGTHILMNEEQYHQEKWKNEHFEKLNIHKMKYTKKIQHRIFNEIVLSKLL